MIELAAYGLVAIVFTAVIAKEVQKVTKSYKAIRKDLVQKPRGVKSK